MQRSHKSATILAYSYNIGFDDYETQALNPDYFGKKGDNTAFLHFFIEQEDKTAKKLNGVKTQEGYLDDHLLGRGAHVKASLTEIEIAIPGISTSKDLSNKYYGDLLFENKEQGITSETFGSPPENFGDKAPDKPQEVKVERGLKIDSNKNMTFYYRLFRENNGQQETLKTTQYPPKK